MPNDYLIELDEFAKSIEDIVGGMDQRINKSIEPAVTAACKRSNKSVRKGARKSFNDPFKKTGFSGSADGHLSDGRYFTGFSYKVDKHGKRKCYGEVGNKKYPGLVHLLEKGHATIGGGFVKGVKHVEPAAEEGFDVLERELDKAVEEAM